MSFLREKILFSPFMFAYIVYPHFIFKPINFFLYIGEISKYSELVTSSIKSNRITMKCNPRNNIAILNFFSSYGIQLMISSKYIVRFKFN